MVEVLGTAASIIILLSGLVKGEKHLRTINTVGAFLMFVYGIMIGKFPVWFLNAALMLAHAKRIYELERKDGKTL